MSTPVSRIKQAPRAAVHQAFLDQDAVASWLLPETMPGRVHAFEPREGGVFQMSLTDLNPEHSPGGKPTRDTDQPSQHDLYAS